jgi:hypothetical protein
LAISGSHSFPEAPDESPALSFWQACRIGSPHNHAAISTGIKPEICNNA